MQALIGEFTIANIKNIKWNALAFKLFVIKENKKNSTLRTYKELLV